MVITPPSITAACVVTGLLTTTAEAAAVAVVRVAASLASEESKLETACTGTALWVIATGVVVGAGGGGVDDGGVAWAASGEFATFSGPIRLDIDAAAVPVAVEIASGAVLAIATTEAFAVPERMFRDDDDAGPTHSAISPSGSSTHWLGAYRGRRILPETMGDMVSASRTALSWMIDCIL